MEANRNVREDILEKYGYLKKDVYCLSSHVNPAYDFQFHKRIKDGWWVGM